MYYVESPAISSIIDVMKMTVWGESRFPARFLEVGQEVIAIGHALGLPGGPTVSKGVVSALDRSIQVDAQTTMVDLIQTDAAINPGNSGGPLLTNRAEVIGMNTAGFLGSQGISFAINIDDAKIVVAQLMERGYIDRGFLGISPANLPPALGNQLDVPVIEGLLVVQVVPDSPAAKAGLQEEDVIVELGDEPIRNTGELSKFLIAHPLANHRRAAVNHDTDSLLTLELQPKHGRRSRVLGKSPYIPLLKGGYRGIWISQV